MSEIRADTISAANGTDPATLTGQSAAKAWAHYDNNGAFEVRDTLNVSSITDTASGRATLIFTNSMANTNYSSPASGGDAGASATFYGLNPETQAVGSTELRGRAQGGSTTTGLSDLTFNFVAIHGDLA